MLPFPSPNAPKRRRLRSLLASGAVAVTALAVAVPAATAEVGDTNGPGHLNVEITDTSGVRLGGACFEIWTEVGGEPDTYVEQVCDTDGNLLLNNRPEGSYILHEIQPPSLKLPPNEPSESHVYQKANDKQYSISPNLVTEFDVEHQRGAAIDVHLQDPDGNSISGGCFEARGMIYTEPGVPAVGNLIDQGCTGTTSSVRLFVPSGQVVVSQTTAPVGYGFAPNRFPILADDDIEDVEMRMSLGSTLRIKQLDDAGELAPGDGCYAALTRPSDGSEGEYVASACDGDDDAGDDGFVVFDTLQDGPYTLVESQGPVGFLPYPDPIDVSLTNSQTIDVAHVPLPTVTARSVDPGGKAITDTCWNVYWPGQYEGWVASACDGDDGTLDGATVFTTLQPGPWEVQVWNHPDGYENPYDLYPITIVDKDIEVVVELQHDGNGEPVANDDSASIDEDTTAVVDVLANDTDPDDDDLTITLATTPSVGTTSVTPDNQVKFVPPANFHGGVTIEYAVHDGREGSDIGAVQITVNSVNDVPHASTDGGNTTAGVAFEIPVLNNDSDVDNDQLVPVIDSAPGNGTVEVLANGQVRYTPNAGFAGNDTFTYRASDGVAESAPATVHVLVQPGDPRGCTITGTEGNDNLVGTSGADVICGLGGNDTIRGHGGDDVIYGDAGLDLVSGDAGNDTIYGGDGADLLSGGSGNDRLDGNGGFLNLIFGDGGRDGARNGIRVSCEYTWR